MALKPYWLQAAVLRRGEYSVYVNDTYVQKAKTKTATGILRKIRPNLSPSSKWRLYVGRFNRECNYPIMCVGTPLIIKGLEVAGPCIARGSFDKIWPLFVAHVRML